MKAQRPEPKNSIGFVGLGDMGGPIAHRIAAAGFPLAVWSRGVHSLKELGAQPYVAVPSLQELGNRCGLVAVCVFSDADVRDVVLGADGLLAAMSPDSILVIHSTVSVDVCCEVALAGASRGVHVLDAPVTGARAAAVNGTLTIMVGGDPSLRNRITPLFESYGRLIKWMGPVGSGQKMKALNNVLGFATGQIASIAIETGVALGLDPASLVAVLESGSAASFALQSLVHNMIPDPEFTAHASAMIAKDTMLFQEVCRRDELSPTVLEQLAVDRITHPVPDVSLSGV
jgi:3-hydroxyisobutyrate dehydrogenase-like beta-hydroxyacid dehydrogenase